jgi:hypothetical protein
MFLVKIEDTLAPGKYRYCSKHIVVMSWFDQDVKKSEEDDWRYFAISGFVMSFEDRWFLATAGHIVRDLEHNRINCLTRVRSMGIIDHGGAEAEYKDVFPFDYDGSEKYWVVDDDGLDFGFIEIQPFYRKTMEANKVTPITEWHWDRDEDHEFEEYFVMGLPSNQQIRLGGIEAGESTLEGRARIIVMPILKVSGDEAPPQKSTPVTFAKVRDERVRKIEHVDGFSGSPVIGMGPKNEDGTIPYRVVAMQYAWDANKHVVILSPVRTFARLFQQYLAAKR